jgi:hypothetical protein
LKIIFLVHSQKQKAKPELAPPFAISLPISFAAYFT